MHATTLAARKCGSGPIGLNGTVLYCYFEFRPQTTAKADGHEPSATGRQWLIRLSFDEFEYLNLHSYERVRIRLPRHEEADAYFTARRDEPPFVWLRFDQVV
jgi:hypothetical protein